MLSWFSNKPKTNAALPFHELVCDMHSHLLPGIDDGTKTMEESIHLVRGLIGLGYKKLITTPHVMHDFYPNTRDNILRKRDDLRTVLKQEGMDVPIEAAAEYLIDEYFEKSLKSEAPLSIGNNFVLVELSFQHKYHRFHEVIFELQMKGYRPVLAHPERYSYFWDTSEIENIKDMGCYLQVNILSLCGYYGKLVKAKAIQLQNKGMVDFWGTDMHHDRHLTTLNSIGDLGIDNISTSIAILQNHQL
jgi:protein-tyrosine phosphatase